MSFLTTEEHRETIVQELVSSFRTKYDRGQAEHGGGLWQRDNISEAKQEILDLVSYVFTADWQRREAIASIELFLGQHHGDGIAPLHRALDLLRGGSK